MKRVSQIPLSTELLRYVWTDCLARNFGLEGVPDSLNRAKDADI